MMLPGKRLARAIGAARADGGRGIEDHHRQFAEIAAAHLRRRNRDEAIVRRHAVPVAIVGAEEEDAVPLDGSAEGEAELVLVLLRARRREESAGVENRVAEVLVRRAVELVRAGLDRVVLRALPVELDRLAAGLHLELLDRIDRDRELQRAALALPHGIGDRQTFDVDILRKALAAVDEAERAAFLHARHEVDEGGGIARIAVAHRQRQRRVHLVAHGLAHARVGGVQLGRRRRNRDAFGRCANFELRSISTVVRASTTTCSCTRVRKPSPDTVSL